jgi:hypothetical protein
LINRLILQAKLRPEWQSPATVQELHVSTVFFVQKLHGRNRRRGAEIRDFRAPVPVLQQTAR